MRQPPSHDPVRGKAAHVARHRAPKRIPSKHRRRSPSSWRRSGGTKLAVGAALFGCLAFAALASGSSNGARHVDTAALSAADQADRGTGAGRSYGRLATQDVIDQANKVLAPEIAAAKEAEEAKRRAEAEAAEAARKAEEARKALPVPAAGLDQAQMNNAKRIVEAGQALGLAKRAFVIAVATSMQECNLYNLASTRLPESYSYPNEGSGSDHDSVGLFQQRPSSGWGTVAQIMDPAYAAAAFYRVLVTVPGWDTMELTYAAQRVQVSAFPTAYAKHEARAQAVVDALVP